MFKYRDHEVAYIANKGWITRDPDGEVTHEGLPSVEAAVEQIIYDTKPFALEIVKKLREVAQIETGLLYSRRNMLIDAATTIEGLIPTAFEYRIEIGGDDQGNRWGTETWTTLRTFKRGTTVETVKEAFRRLTTEEYKPELSKFFRMVRRRVYPAEWEVFE